MHARQEAFELLFKLGRESSGNISLSSIQVPDASLDCHLRGLNLLTILAVLAHDTSCLLHLPSTSRMLQPASARSMLTDRLVGSKSEVQTS